MTTLLVSLSVIVLLSALALRDRHFSKHTVVRNFPLIGWLRFAIESVGPEFRQYIVAGDREEKPFTRVQRGWIMASAKRQNNRKSFGTDLDPEAPDSMYLRHAAFPYVPKAMARSGVPPDHRVPCAKVMGQWRGRKHAFRPESIVMISGMSYGSLSSAAVEAMNKGAKLSACLHNTGEGGIAPHHKHGAELIFQIGTGYFGARDAAGNFSIEALLNTIRDLPVRAIEVKLSQGAKPNKGGILPKAKITREIVEIRGISADQDCISPAHHREFHTVDGLIDFVERIAAATGLPVGIKSAVGDMDFWKELATRMRARSEGPDFITIDGGEGGTGAAPPVFQDYVSLPFKIGFSRVYSVFAEHGMHEKVIFIGSGKLGFPEKAILALALGCDMIAVGREVMISVGCIQSMRCHTGICPTGVATHKKWLVNGLDPTFKSVRVANYLLTLRQEILEVSHACGVCHPAFVGTNRIEFVRGGFKTTNGTEQFGYQPEWGYPSADELAETKRLMES